MSPVFLLSLWIFHIIRLRVNTAVIENGADRCSIQDLLVNCSSRGFNKIPADLPPNTSVLILSFNPIQNIRKEDLRRLNHLHTLDISHCQLQNISAGSFDSLNKLEILDLSYNELTSLSFSKGVLQPLQHLRTLNLMYNCYSKSPQILEEVCGVPSLQKLQIEGTLNLTFPIDCKPLQNLNTLEFGPCDIQHLTNKTFWSLKDSALSSINMKLCNLHSAESGVFSQLKNLSIIDLSQNDKIGLNNAIASLGGLQNRNITSLILNDVNNNTKYPGDIVLNKKDLEPLSNLHIRELNLAGNHIVAISPDCIELKFWNYIEILNVSKNNLVSLNYVAVFQSRTIFKNLRLSDLSYQGVESTFRQPPGGTSGSVLNLMDMNVPPNLQVLNFSHIQTKYAMRWPTETIQRANSLKIIDMSFSNFAFFGAFPGLDQLIWVDISGLRKCQFNFTLATYPALKTLKVANSDVGNKCSNTALDIFFRGAHNLADVDLSNNGLSGLTDSIFIDQYESLLRINFSSNFFKNFPLTLNNFKHLSNVDVSMNKIERLTSAEMSEIDQYWQASPNFSLSVANNNLSCRCEDLDFLTWICNTNALQETDRKSYCIQDDSNRELIENLCNSLETAGKDCSVEFWIIFSSTSLGFVSILLLISAIIYRNRVEVKYYLLRFSVRARRYQELEGGNVHFVYDAFVAYSHHDHQWVCQDMRRRLEGNHGFRLCLHHRDFPVAVPISHNIMETMEKSRKVILVVSRHFVRSDWAEFELEMATMFRSQHQRDMLVVVLLESIPYKDMPRTLRGIWRKITCLEWPKDTGSLADVEWFWSELVKTLKAR